MIIKITLEEYKQCKANAIVCSGTTVDSPEGLHMTGSGKPLRWVMKKGMVEDWCVYCNLVGYNEEEVARHGDKVHDMENIGHILDLPDELYKKYRH